MKQLGAIILFALVLGGLAITVACLRVLAAEAWCDFFGHAPEPFHGLRRCRRCGEILSAPYKNSGDGR